MIVGAARGGRGRRAARHPRAAARRHLPRRSPRSRSRSCSTTCSCRSTGSSGGAAAGAGARARRSGRSTSPTTSRSSCFCVVVLVDRGRARHLVRAGTTGRYLDALRGSEIAAAVDRHQPGRGSRIVAFALSAGIAGLGGGLLAIQTGRRTTPRTSSRFIGLVWVVLVRDHRRRGRSRARSTPASRSRSSRDPRRRLGLSRGWQFILFGLGAITYAKHPEGIVEARSGKSIEFFQRKFDQRRQRRAARPT